MVMVTAPEVPFNPDECPRCEFYVKLKDENRCKGYTTPHPVPGIPPLLAMFNGESTKACPRFSEARKT
jgi:hypothetical protein